MFFLPFSSTFFPPALFFPLPHYGVFWESLSTLHSVLSHSAGLLIFGSVNILGCFGHSPPPLELPWVMFLVGCLASFLGFTYYRPVVTTKNISVLAVPSLGMEK